MKKVFFYVMEQDGDLEIGSMEGGNEKKVCRKVMKRLGFDECSKSEIYDYIEDWSDGIEDGVLKMVDDFGNCVYVGVDEDIVYKTYMSEIVEKLKEALEKHRAYLDSINDDVCNILNDSGYYVSGAIESLDEEIFLLENCLGMMMKKIKIKLVGM